MLIPDHGHGWFLTSDLSRVKRLSAILGRWLTRRKWTTEPNPHLSGSVRFGPGSVVRPPG